MWFEIGGQQLIRVKTIRQIRKAVLPLRKNQEIDLLSAFRELASTDFVVRYEPECGINALCVRINNVTFNIFSNGTICILGSKRNANKILTFFWRQHLRQFVVEV